MDIHEYQAKEILASFGIPVPRGALAYSPEQASYRSTELGGSMWVVKAQVHSGGRGRAGGVRLCRTDHDVADAAAALLGKRLVTAQAPRGRQVRRVYVEQAVDVEWEFYFGITLDRSAERVTIIASAEGGVEIEELAERAPEAVVQRVIDPATGFLDFQARELAFAVGIGPSLVAQATTMFRAAYRAFRDLDATVVEINPLVRTKDDRLVALDAAMSFDDNATFRHPEVGELRDRSQRDPRETFAADHGLSYVGLEGDIGCIINGAGLAMATMDMIELSGGRPANFLDIGGGASPERVHNAFRAVLQDASVRVILINIFAGINRCDWIADGIVSAFTDLELAVPVVVRLCGTNGDDGDRILRESGLPITTADTLADAARRAVAAARDHGTDHPAPEVTA